MRMLSVEFIQFIKRNFGSLKELRLLRSIRIAGQAENTSVGEFGAGSSKSHQTKNRESGFIDDIRYFI